MLHHLLHQSTLYVSHVSDNAQPQQQTIHHSLHVFTVRVYSRPARTIIYLPSVRGEFFSSWNGLRLS